MTNLKHQVYLSIIASVICLIGVNGYPCANNTGWFGHQCNQYKCHCPSSECDKDNGCPESSICDFGWFGPACQYVDLVQTNSTTNLLPWKNYDCAKENGSQIVSINFTDVFYFTWLRLYLGQSGISTEYSVDFTRSDNGLTKKCSDMKIASFNNSIVDIYCEPGVEFNQITITGNAIKSLCSISVSGGRNVALMQYTNQTSTWGRGPEFYLFASGKAVDGDRYSTNGHNCAHNGYENPSSWTLYFQQLHRITRYVIFNRLDVQLQRLNFFSLTTLQEDGSTAFTYKDTGGENQTVYYIRSNRPDVVIKSVSITGREYLTLCEVEMYGDTDCDKGKYGRECENICNCNKEESCFVSTGICFNRCPNGYHGEQCDIPCDAPYFGEKCSQLCSTNCTNQTCNAIDGTCLSCIPGKHGQYCDKECGSTFYGVNCNQRCNERCKDKLCDPANGDCKSCEQGLTGAGCSETNIGDGSVPKGAIIGPIIVLIILVALVIICVIIWRKHHNRKKDPKSNSGRHEHGNMHFNVETNKYIEDDIVKKLWEQKSEVVVMFTYVAQKGEIKYDKYWSDDGPINIGGITIKLASTLVYADYTIRKLELYKKAETVHVLIHFHYTIRFDKDLCLTAWGLVDLAQRMWKIKTDKSIVVHCGSDENKTKTVKTVQYILKKGERAKQKEFFEKVQTLLIDNKFIINTSNPYALLNKASEISLVCKGTSVTTSNIQSKIQILEEISFSKMSNLEEEYESICRLCDDKDNDKDNEYDQVKETYVFDKVTYTNNIENTYQVEPSENTLVLPRLLTNLRCQFKAVFVPSFNRHDRHILSQLPLPTQIIDFWQLVTECNVALIVSFEKKPKTWEMTDDNRLQGDYANTPSSPFKVTINSCDSKVNWKVEKFTIEKTISATSEDPSNINKEYLLSHISCNKTNLKPDDLIQLVKQIWSVKPVGEGRILFMCRDGATFSGLVCVLSLLLEKMDNDQEVSVPLVLGTVKAIRSQVIPTLDQYRLLYETLQLFSETSMYSKFDEV